MTERPKDWTYKEASAKAAAREVRRKALGQRGVGELAKRLADKKVRALEKATKAINPLDTPTSASRKVDLIIQEESED